jgi:glycogen(starch) synthase
MRILCHCEGYLPDVIGGQEVLSAHLLGQLRQRGHEILVLTSCVAGRPAGRYSYEGLPLHKFEFGPVLQSGQMEGIVRVQKDVYDTVREFRPDVMHLNDARVSSFFFLRRDVLRDIPRALTLHSPLRPFAKSGLQNRLMQEANIIVAVSQSIANNAVETVPSIERKLIVIRNALPLPPVLPSPLPEAPVTFLCLGRIVEEKGINLAIEALAMLSAQGLKANLVVLGDGPQKEALQQLVHERALQEHVRFRGWVMPEDIPAAINEATAVLVPSRWKEPFGLVALQAAQMGRPVIASSIGGLPEIVVHEETGLLVSPDDVTALATAMSELIRNADLAKKMGDAACSRVTCYFDFASLVVGYEKVFLSIQ